MSMNATVMDDALEKATPTLIAALGAPARFKAAALALLSFKDAGLVMTLPDGRRLAFGDRATAAQAELVVRDYCFIDRIFAHGDIGFAEGYIAKEWDTPDLSAVLIAFSANLDRILRLLRGHPLMRVLHMLRHLGRENTKDGARRNILEHYDLGNRFYSAWLDPTMTYSAALIDKPGQPLAEAQLRKYRALAQAIDLKPGEHVLEIGCGWGGFAEVAAKEFGARVTGLTISNEQHAFASARMQGKGLSDMVEIRLQDYRDVQGPFDKIASIEMFEAVGEKYWPAYFSKISSVLRPGGKAGLQVITIEDRLFESYRKRVDFIQRYVFPGGMLPSRSRLEEEAKRAGLAVSAPPRAFALGYAETLAEWRRRFHAAWNEIQAMGFDERFRRLWQFYLSYCEAGFRTGRTDVIQMALTRP